LEPITDVWNEVKGNEIFPKGLAAVCYFEGQAWAMPVDLHTLNEVWYNVSVFKRLGLKPPETWADFAQVCRTLKSNSIAPMTAALRGPWAVYTLFPFLIETLGATGYRDLGRGEISFQDDRIKKAFAMYKEYWIDNLFDGWSGYGWVEAAQPLMEGKAGMYFAMGDWVAALLEKQGMKPIEQFDFFFAPSTRNILIGQVDTFAIAKGSKSLKAAKLFIKQIASIEGQRAFNKLKGSLASNVNVQPDLYGPIHQKLYQTLKNPNTVLLPNQVFLMSPNFYASMQMQIEKYAINPTPDTLVSVLKELEGLRMEEFLGKKWVNWQW
jgi:glucose/mannose transport system substrate-binding protein